MNLALKEAKKAYKEDEVPVGCVLVLNDEVIAKAYNHKEKKNDTIAHAEIECIKKAEKKLNTWYLNNLEMYVTLEPCMMCTGAIINSRIKKIYIGTNDPKGGCFKSCIDIDNIKNINHHPKYEFGLLQDECASMLKDFFKQKRK